MWEYNMEKYKDIVQRIISLIPELSHHEIVCGNNELYITYNVPIDSIGDLLTEMMNASPTINETNYSLTEFNNINKVLYFTTHSEPDILPKILGDYSMGYSITAQGHVKEKLFYEPDDDHEGIEYEQIVLSVRVNEKTIERMDYLSEFSDDALYLLMREEGIILDN